MGTSQYDATRPDHAPTVRTSRRRHKLRIAGGAVVAAITLVVPEALLDWTDGSLGTAGMLLATGVTLLVASLLGLRLRQEVGTPPSHLRRSN